MKPSFQIWLRAALAVLLAFAGLFGEPVHTARAYTLISAAAQGSTTTYDDEGNVAYDSSYRSQFSYDGGATPPEYKYGHQLSGYRVPFGIFSDFLAAEETSAGNTFFHYTQAEIPAGQGLNVGSGVTSVGNLNASEAMFQLGIEPPTYVYPVTLENPADYLIQDLGTPARSQIPSWQVIRPTPPGSVGLPTSVPPAP